MVIRGTSSREAEDLSIDVDYFTSLKGKFICCILKPTSNEGDLREGGSFWSLKQQAFSLLKRILELPQKAHPALSLFVNSRSACMVVKLV